MDPFLQSLEDDMNKPIEKQSNEKKADNPYQCDKCHRPYIHRSGFFFCGGCGNLIDVDKLQKKLKEEAKKNEPNEMEDIFRSMNRKPEGQMKLI